MPEFVLILWLPVATACMAVAWVLTLGAIGQPRVVAEETAPAREER